MIINGDSIDELKKLDDNSVDLIVTDPPYGYSFMGKDWDKAVPKVEIWQECLRVLKSGAFIMVMSAPRQDVLSHMIVNLDEAGFNTSFTSLYWTYASGFPKASNIGKMVDKRLGVEDKREFSHKNPADRPYTYTKGETSTGWQSPPRPDKTKPYSDEAKALDGSYGGFQPKPAVEVILVAMKPLSEKTYVDQALKNKKGITWLDSCRIPYESEGDKSTSGTFRPAYERGAKYDGTKGNVKFGGKEMKPDRESAEKGRFPANLLVSDDVLNDGTKQRTDYARGSKKKYNASSYQMAYDGDRGVKNETPTSYSRYFDLDKWANQLPFLITPKASKSEKNKGLEGFEDKQTGSFDGNADTTNTNRKIGAKPDKPNEKRKNHHPTVKPLKLMSYLIQLGSREGDVILDPFCGSGTTCIAAKELRRKYIGIEREKEYVDIAEARLKAVENTLFDEVS